MSLISCADLPTHVVEECPDYIISRNSAVGIIYKDANIADYTAAGDWNTAIAANSAVIVKGLAGVYEEPSDIQIENPEDCGADQILIAFDHVFSFQDGNVSEFNSSFYEELNKFKGYFCWYNCEEDKIFVVDTATVTFVAKPAWGARGEILKYTVMAQWREDRDVFYVIHDAPAGIFT